MLCLGFIAITRHYSSLEVTVGTDTDKSIEWIKAVQYQRVTN